jgi:hypothetical protein
MKKINIQTLVVQLVHIFVFGIFLLYIGIAIPRQKWIYRVVSFTGIVVFLYWVMTMKTHDIFWTVWHLLLSVVLIWIGVQMTASPVFLFKLCLIYGWAAIGYHSTRLIQNLIRSSH